MPSMGKYNQQYKLRNSSTCFFFAECCPVGNVCLLREHGHSSESWCGQLTSTSHARNAQLLHRLSGPQSTLLVLTIHFVQCEDKNGKTPKTCFESYDATSLNFLNFLGQGGYQAIAVVARAVFCKATKYPVNTITGRPRSPFWI